MLGLKSMTDIFDALPDADKGGVEEYKKGKDALTAYFAPKKNVEYEIYQFRNSAKQQSGENLDTFHTRLRRLAQQHVISKKID
jgi:hypothetical protein